jgi:hypothetical protein
MINITMQENMGKISNFLLIYKLSSDQGHNNYNLEVPDS